MNIKKITGLALVCVAISMFTSCKTPENVAYFQNDDAYVVLNQATQIRVKPDDKLAIVVKSKDAEVTELFNLGNYSYRIGTPSTSTADGVAYRTSRPVAGDGVSLYTVGKNGCIDFPILGSLKIEGMTRGEVAAYIKGELMGRDLVKDPVVTVEFANTGINVMGMVKNPGRYEINKDEITILEGLSLAGDLELNAVRENVKVLREEDGRINIYKMDLTDLKKLTQSPAYYLQQNDVIYVEPNDKSKRSTSIRGNEGMTTSFWISVASLITTAVTTVGVFVNK